jgi:hypothetical protein
MVLQTILATKAESRIASSAASSGFAMHSNNGSGADSMP